ncbi:MAG: hypothetical protein US98_C0009G0008 [Parcubacteria group bacterium GW2011_GWC1_38_6]|nr:MAG: hypothetical protein US98_C0009G0008 [Parcubacteria group bacterium GW2011_GWC1_38_6]
MAIEIIPKKKERKSITLIGAIFYFSVILLLSIFLISLLLLGFQLTLNRNISNVKAKIDSVATPEDLMTERKVTLTQKKINDFAFLIDNHRSNEKFFASFEKLVHPKIFFSEINLRLEQGRATLSGKTDNFEILGQQFLILEKEGYIKSVVLSKSEIDKEGKISFVVEVSFDSNNFKY